MSILLEALRKSEKDQQKVAAPSIHSAEQSKPVSGLLNKGWLLLIIVALLVGATFAWYQYRKTEATYQPPVTLKSDLAMVEDGKSAPGNEKNTPPAMVASGGAGRQRTPVETYQKPASTESKTPAATTAKGKSAKSKGPEKQVAKDVKRKPATKKPAAKKSAAKKPATKKPATKKPATNKPTAKQAATGNPAKASPKKFQPQQPAPISYW